MVYKSKIGDINLHELKRVYPASIVELEGDVSEMSLEWTDMNKDKVKVLRYVLVFDFTPPNQEEKIKTSIPFDSENELISELRNVAEVLNG